MFSDFLTKPVLYDFCKNTEYVKKLQEEVESLGKMLKAFPTSLCCAESCTAGLAGAAITSYPGASSFFKGGIITYTNEMKKNMLGVKEETLKKFTEVSRETAGEMAFGAAKSCHCRAAFSITGFAGNGQSFDTEEQKVKNPDDGKVCFGFYTSGVGRVPEKLITEEKHFTGTRDEIRIQAVIYALKTIGGQICDEIVYSD